MFLKVSDVSGMHIRKAEATAEQIEVKQSILGDNVSTTWTLWSTVCSDGRHSEEHMLDVNMRPCCSKVQGTPGDT